MYFSAARTEAFVRELLGLMFADPAHESLPLLDSVDVFVIPDHVTLAGVVAQVAHHGIMVGAQDCHSEDAGAFTGAVSPAVLAEVGCRLVELGHAERRRLFAETDASAAAKAAAVVRNAMVPLVCVGEERDDDEDDDEPHIVAAADEVLVQVRSALAAVPADTDVVLAYEPVWAIGASAPAPIDHVRAVVRRVRASDAVRARAPGRTRIVYGGSAGPGLFTRIAPDVDGLFLGRFAHDPAQFFRTVCEVAQAPW
ncbi:triosephosphate isomerase [Lasiosphaeria miniovina]|uniref:Triosephosphate isomerase n=1 Tax=Lasiosphaeria miniovina TaxID=1954250 RepID=A0AA40E021_9PEZI|nr:triosephosphate isomerase [Lasiosphaeria miniovina]KAK0722030.1 triosephosphate isomerase [Lasiosphaeria miniovina]